MLEKIVGIFFALDSGLSIKVCPVLDFSSRALELHRYICHSLRMALAGCTLVNNQSRETVSHYNIILITHNCEYYGFLSFELQPWNGCLAC